MSHCNDTCLRASKRNRFAKFLKDNGFTYLLTRQDGSAKLSHNVAVSDQYISWVLYMEPDDKLCPAKTALCFASCLRWSGRLAMSNAPAKRTRAFHVDQERFVHRLVVEVDNAIAYAKARGKVPTFRFNGTSDVDWPTLIRRYYPDFYERRAGCIFYEYTKRPDLALRYDSPVRYTFSRSDVNTHVAMKCLTRGVNVAVVFATKKGQPLPATWEGRTVIDGDKHDMRFLDPVQVVVGLRAKGKATKANNKFIVKETA